MKHNVRFRRLCMDGFNPHPSRRTDETRSWAPWRSCCSCFNPHPSRRTDETARTDFSVQVVFTQSLFANPLPSVGVILPRIRKILSGCEREPLEILMERWVRAFSPPDVASAGCRLRGDTAVQSVVCCSAGCVFLGGRLGHVAPQFGCGGWGGGGACVTA